LVSYFVGVTFRDGFGGEEEIIGHGVKLQVDLSGVA